MAKIKTQTREAKIKASSELWTAFDEYCEKRGYQSTAEGIRAAIIEVTNFNGSLVERSPRDGLSLNHNKNQKLSQVKTAEAEG